MNKEDMQKAMEALGKANINIAGDFVMEKHVDYEIGNVESGGIGISILNSTEEKTDDSLNAIDNIPTSQQMQQAVAATVKNGMWWSSRCWAVVYRVYQIKGYVNNYTYFINEVKSWTVKTGYECNYDAIQKPMVSGIYVGNPERWEKNGAQKQAVRLAVALMEELDKMLKHTPDDNP